MTLQLPDNPDRLDQLLTDHFSNTLEPQRGKALAAFRRQTTTQKTTPERNTAPIPFIRRDIPRRALWYWAGVPSALAACLAVVVTLHFTRTPAINGGSLAKQPAVNQAINQFESSRDVPGEVTYLSDGTPVRPVYHQTVRETQWVDPTDHATYTLTEPGQKVDYIQVQPF